MTVWNLGSINIDNVYRVRHLPGPGETLAAYEYQQGLGGKGANMSVAAARAAAHVCHIGAIGGDGRWARDRMLEYGVDTRHIVQGQTATGHANIALDDDGENQIILFPGANRDISVDQVKSALTSGSAADTLLIQNETNAQVDAALVARSIGMRVIYAAAPFEIAAVESVLAHIDILVLNAVEAAQLEAAMGKALTDLPVSDVVVTLGGDGSRHFDLATGTTTDIPAIAVDVVDTTGAGDTFTGYLAAGLDRGLPMRQALDLATQAAALMVTRLGTADVIPDLKDIEDWRLS